MAPGPSCDGCCIIHVDIVYFHDLVKGMFPLSTLDPAMNMPATAPDPAPAPAEILARQRAAFLRDGAPGIAERKADLKRLRRTLIAWRPRIEAAVKKVLAQGYRTGDIYEAGTQRVGTRAMGDAVLAAL